MPIPTPSPSNARRSLCAVALLAAGILALPAASRAQTVVKSTGNINVLTSAPADTGTFASNTDIYGFKERQNVLLTSRLNVDITAANVLYGPVPTPTSIAAGTYVNSFYLYTNAASFPPARDYSGTITFGSDILGLIVTTPRFNQSDPVVGLSGTNYSTQRPPELGNLQDTVFISQDRRTLTFTARTTTNIDAVRVITAVTPEASSVANLAGALLAPGMIGMVAVRRRKRTVSAA